MSQIWGVPIHSEIFKGINQAQWLWYFYMYSDDMNEDFTIKRDLLEYHAGFLEPEIVGKVRDAREKEAGDREGVIGTKNEKEFSEGIGKLFGKSLEGEEYGIALADSITERDELANINKGLPIYNYKHWLDLELE